MPEPSGSRRGLSSEQQALLALRRLKARVEELEAAAHEPIAIDRDGLSFSGGADGPEQFWNLLQHGVDAVSEVPADRWDVDAYYDPDPDAPGKMYTRFGALHRRASTSSTRSSSACRRARRSAWTRSSG